MKNQQILFLTANDIKNTISMKQTIVLMKNAFKQISQGVVHTPLRTKINIDKFEGNALFMPACSDENDLISLKVVTVFKNNPKIQLPLIHALVFLMDGTTGQPLAIMDGEYLTALRTGAASGLATDLLSRRNSETLGLFGAGVQGRTQAEAVSEVRNIQRIFVYDKNKQVAQLFAKMIPNHINVEINPPVNRISECDIICTATTSSSPVFNDVYISKGTHINAIGAYQADKREIPGETIKRSKLVVDQRSACLKEAGDLIIPLKEKLVDKKHIYAELGQLLSGDMRTRSDNSEITVFKSVGNAAQDLLTAGEIYKKAQTSGIGTVISL